MTPTQWVLNGGGAILLPTGQVAMSGETFDCND